MTEAKAHFDEDAAIDEDEAAAGGAIGGAGTMNPRARPLW
jgi:hypothetical protein